MAPVSLISSNVIWNPGNMNLYFISGLGADKRVFQKLEIPEPFIIHHVEWVPVQPEDSLPQYCSRLIEQLNLNEPFILVGLSFGGIVAIELSKKIKPAQTVLISSIASPQEVGRLYTLLGKLKLQKIIPLRFFLKPSRMIYRLFGAHTKEEKNLLENILLDTDPVFFRWAMDRTFSWKNDWKPGRLLHIHGTSDKILPYNKNMQAIKVEGGEHLMVYSRAMEISRLFLDHLIKK
jgi:pimeloyl-ACP methyl ester carboxylesterase